MGEARLSWAWLALAGGLAVAAVPARAQSRFLSYGSEPECLGAHALPAALCRSAFANARAEFEARTPSFPSLALCAKSFGDCAAWPPGGPAPRSFRPRWTGVDIVDTPGEKSVTPAAVSGVRRLTFAPQPLTAFRSLDVRGVRRPEARPASREAAPASPAGTASAPPGSGFKLEDGVLTFPAPERFQPKNLPRQP